jgi:hypothetical protein
MGFLQGLLNPEPQKKQPGVCIPDAAAKKARKKAKEEEERQPPEPVIEGSGFVVSGLFHIQDTVMIQGTAHGRAVRAKSEGTIKGKKVRVKEILMGSAAVKELQPGQHGALFVSAKELPIIKSGDLIKF